MLYNRLKNLGGTPIVRRGDGDDQHEFGLDYELENWLKELWAALLEAYPLPTGVEIISNKQYPIQINFNAVLFDKFINLLPDTA